MKRVVFVNFDVFYSLLRAYRICWIRGRFGGGKTLLAVALSAKLLADRYVDYCVSNIPIEFGVKPCETDKITDWCIVLDESWIYLNTKSSVYSYAAFVRKVNHFILLPSVWPVHSRLQSFSVQRVFNGYVVGVPIWVYRYDIRMRVYSEKGYFGLLYPHALFGVYDTTYIPGDDAGISEIIDRNIGVIRRMDSDENEDEVYEIVSELDDAVSSINESVDAVEDMVKVIKRKRR